MTLVSGSLMRTASSNGVPFALPWISVVTVLRTIAACWWELVEVVIDFSSGGKKRGQG